MPVIDVYENKEKLGAPADFTDKVHVENPGAMALAKSNGDLLGGIALSLGKLKDQMDTADVMKANNEYNLRMGELIDKLHQNKEEFAAGNMDALQEGRQKIINDILKKGPHNLRGGTASVAFRNTIDRDWVGQHNGMLSYVSGEMEKYSNTQYMNQLDSSIRGVTDGYMDNETMENMMDRADFFAMGRFHNYGPERVHMEQQKARAAVTSAAITSALAADNYDRAGELLQQYGTNLSPEERMKFDKIAQEYRKTNFDLNSFENIYRICGKNIEKGISMLQCNSSMDLGSGKTFLEKSMGQQLGPNQCANFTTKYLQTIGADERLYSSLADGMQLNAERLGLAYNNRSQLKDGDLVFWASSSRHEASENPADVQSNTKAYHGTTHVGVYDAKTGKVIQSGNSGVRAIDLDAYPVTGFARVQGKEYTPLQKQEEINKYMAYVRQQEALKSTQNNYIAESTMQEMYVAFQQGERNPQTFLNIARRNAGNDLSLQMELEKMASGFSTGDGRNRKMSPEDVIYLEDRISKGISQTELIKLMRDMEFKDETIIQWMDKNKKAIAGEGEYKVNWHSMIDIIRERGINVKKENEPGLTNAGKDFVRSYIAKNHVPPSDSEIINYLQESMTEGKEYGGATIENKWINDYFTRAQLRSHNISAVEDMRNGQVKIHISDVPGERYMDKKKFVDYINDKITWEEASK